MSHEYLMPASDLAHIPLHDLRRLLSARPRIAARDVTIGQLASLTQHPTGVYLFYSAGTANLQYVGKATSRSFIDRIPAHFDPREAAWMNSLPKHIAKRRSCVYTDALDQALALEMTLVGATDTLPGGQIEAVFRGYLRPELNSTKRVFSDELSLEEACRACA